MCRADYSVVMFLSGPRPAHLLRLFVALAVVAGCSTEPERTYPLHGQIMAIGGPPRPDGRRELSVKHEDIPAFMPAMTMGYSVKDPRSLDGLQPGDLVTATLVFDQRHGDMYLANLKKTGHADLPAGYMS